MKAALLLLADGRLPSGGHAHSGGLEQAIADGRVRTVADVGLFVRGVLPGPGLTSAALAAVSCSQPGHWELLCAEFAARTPSAAVRTAAAAQGRALLRTGRRVWPSAALETLADSTDRPPLPLVQGAVAYAAGLSPADAALGCVHSLATGAASAGVRLLGLDPIEVAGMLAELSTEIDRIASMAAGYAHTDLRQLALLPASTGPLLDVLAERHDDREMSLFAS
ncbi:MAG: urease accessory protein [Frankiales bacterium]|jgi:urease accessory protein|nr:urease accessory protein [Frankiales bacterium]